MLSGKKLQYIRIRNNMTQVYIAKCIGVSERWIGMVENAGESPSQEVYDKWLLALYGGLKPKEEKVEKSEPTKVANKKK